MPMADQKQGHQMQMGMRESAQIKVVYFERKYNSYHSHPQNHQLRSCFSKLRIHPIVDVYFRRIVSDPVTAHPSCWPRSWLLVSQSVSCPPATTPLAPPTMADTEK